MHIWGCETKAKHYNPYEKSLNSKIVSDYFIDYLERSKGYILYYPTHSTRVVEIDRAIFLEDVCVSENILRDFIFKESLKDITISQQIFSEENDIYPI